MMHDIEETDDRQIPQISVAPKCGGNSTKSADSETLTQLVGVL